MHCSVIVSIVRGSSRNTCALILSIPTICERAPAADAALHKCRRIFAIGHRDEAAHHQNGLWATPIVLTTNEYGTTKAMHINNAGQRTPTIVNACGCSVPRALSKIILSGIVKVRPAAETRESASDAGRYHNTKPIRHSTNQSSLQWDLKAS